jgi:hypothetical protein
VAVVVDEPELDFVVAVLAEAVVDVDLDFVDFAVVVVVLGCAELTPAAVVVVDGAVVVVVAPFSSASAAWMSVSAELMSP